MAKQASEKSQELNLFQRIREYFEEIRVELKKVTWPKWEEVKASTWVVLFLLAVLSIIILAYDTVFSKGVLLLLNWLG